MLSNKAIEWPCINVDGYDTKNYRYVYALHSSKIDDFPQSIVKITVEDGSSCSWKEEGCYPGKPLFVAHPDNNNEDDGVILSSVFDAKMNTTFLLILDAKSLIEVARTIIPTPLPFARQSYFYKVK